MTNNLRVWGSLALCMPLALIGACATTDTPKPLVARSAIQAPGKAAVTVSAADDGASVVLESTQELRVDLPNTPYAVAGNLEWSVVDLKPGVLAVLGSRFERTGRNDNPSESAGVTVWRLKPQAPGSVTLKFELRRARSMNAPQQAVSFDVIVK